MVLNGTDHESKDYLVNNNIQFLQIKKTTPAKARNIAIKCAKMEYLIFLDDDAYLPSHYLESLKTIIASHSNIDVLGGPDKCPAMSNQFQEALSITLTSPISTSSTRWRHIENEREIIGSEENLILCNLIFKRSLFTDEQFQFDTEYFRNEENVLIDQLRRSDKDIRYFGRLFVYHHRKDSYSQLLKPVLRSGFYRGKMIQDIPEFSKWQFFIPSIFLIFLMSSFLYFSSLHKIIFLSYLILVFSFSIFFSIREKKIGLTWPIFFQHIFIHLTYGLGFLLSFFRSSI